MTEKLAERFAAAGLETGLDAEVVKARIVRRHGCPPEMVYLQERHIAQAFQEVLFERAPEPERGPLLERLFGAPSRAQAGDAVGVCEPCCPRGWNWATQVVLSVGYMVLCESSRRAAALVEGFDRHNSFCQRSGSVARGVRHNRRVQLPRHRCASGPRRDTY